MNPKTAKTIRLRLVEPDDAAFIVSMRVDDTKNKYLSPTDGNVENQRKWIERYKAREAEGEEYYFIIEDLNGKPCGCIRMYDFQPPSFCWGSWIVMPWAPPKTAIQSALLIYEIAFFELGFTNCHFDVRLGNEKALAFHDRMGATRTTQSDIDQFFIYPKAKYLEDRVSYAKFLPQKATA